MDLEPVCDGSNDRYVIASAFHCEYANNQIDGIGSFQFSIVILGDGSDF